MKKNLKFYLKNKLSKKELESVPNSYDVVGSIMIFSDFPKELVKKEMIIGEIILKNYNNIKTILKKTKKYSGKYRTPKLKHISGEKTKETIHKENNTVLKLNVEKVYFSSRLSNERLRINNLIKNNEKILVMFSGSGVYPINISKNTKAKETIGIEANPIAHKYALENLKLNKNNNIKLIKGDVKKEIPKLKIKFDRILMPLPKGAEKFLDLALNKIKKKGIIHYYDFSEEDKYDEINEKIKKECNKSKKKCKILKVVKCGQFSPGVNRICVDIRME
jgi:tRNA (guanine37-N1)-methyltransferase